MYGRKSTSLLSNCHIFNNVELKSCIPVYSLFADVNELVECEELPRNEEDEDADKEDTDELGMLTGNMEGM